MEHQQLRPPGAGGGLKMVGAPGLITSGAAENLHGASDVRHDAPVGSPTLGSVGFGPDGGRAIHSAP